MALPVIAITNQCTILSDAQVQAVIPALQRQVSLEFKAYWNLDCTLQFVPKDMLLTNGWWQIVIIDNPDVAGALGYHELNVHGLPLGKVFAKLDITHGLSWTVTFSHELLEMLADPWINWLALGDNGKLYALEVSDPVEADELGYAIDGILVSDFITPKWFAPTHADRYSFKQRISQPFEIAPGGYMSVYDCKLGWVQINRQSGETLPIREAALDGLIPVGSRRHRRAIPKQDWRNSER